MPINLVITNAGRAALVNAANTGTLPVTITQIGISAIYTAPVQTLTALPSELKRLSAIAGQVVADDILHVSMKDESNDSYLLRSIALYLGNGTLFACAGQSDPMLNKASSAVALAAFDIAFDDIDAASISFGDTDFMMPTATTEAPGVVELATVAEAQAGIDALRALTPASAKAAVLGWILSQDGSGSGMDADLLDGQHGSWYADIASRLGYTPLNVAAYTALDVINKLLTVDGAGSGLDGDLLDGQHGSFYTNIPARLGFTPLNSADYTAADVIAKLLTVDGSGSGIDADLLDGFQGSEFIRLAQHIGGNQLLGVNGHQLLPGGLILQWGNASHLDAGGAQTVEFPRVFPTQFLCAAACNISSSAPAAFHSTGAATQVGMIVYSATHSGTPAGFGTAFSWFALGR